MKARALWFVIGVVVGVMCAASPWASAAEGSCPEEFHLAESGAPDTWSTDKQSLADAFGAWCESRLNAGTSCGGQPSSGFEWEVVDCTVTGAGTYGGVSCTGKKYFPSDHSFFQDVSLTTTFTQRIPDECENACAAKAGQKKSLWTFPEESPSESIQTSDGCAATLKQSTCYGAEGGLTAMCVHTYEYTGSEADSGDDEEEGAPGDCASGPSGLLCVEPDKSSKGDCISLNGETVCFEPPPMASGSCAGLPSGGVVCFEDAVSQPDNGTPGVQATPSATVQRAGPGGALYNWYVASILKDSTVPVVTSKPTGTSGSGDGDGAGAEACEGEEDCFGELPDLGDCGDDVVACAAAKAADAIVALQEGVPLLGLVVGLHDALSTSAECPQAVVEIFDDSYDLMAAPCELIAGVQSIWSLMMQIAWALAGLRIIVKE